MYEGANILINRNFCKKKPFFPSNCSYVKNLYSICKNLPALQVNYLQSKKKKLIRNNFSS